MPENHYNKDPENCGEYLVGITNNYDENKRLHDEYESGLE